MSILVSGRRDKLFYAVVRKLIDEGYPISSFLFLHRKLDGEYYTSNGVDTLDHRDMLDQDRLIKLNRENGYQIPIEHFSMLARAEQLYQSVSDRLSADLSPMRWKRYHFFQLASYWYGYLIHHDIKVIIFEALPHSHVNMVLDAVAKLLEIKTLYVERTSISECLFVLESFKEVPRLPKNFLVDASREEIEKCVPDWLSKKVYTQSAWQKNANMNVQKGVSAFKKKAPSSIIKFLRIAYDIYRGKKYPELKNIKKIRRFQLSKKMNFVEHLKHEWRVIRRQHEIYEFYRGNISEYDAREKHIVFYLNFEPERTTIPMGGEINCPLMALDILAAALPHDWTIYVKEHPRQFIRGELGYHYRDLDFYENILSHDCVKFMSPHLSTSEILENAMGVASISGSIGWEAALKGKRSIIFGYPWYAGLPTVSQVDTTESAEKAFKAIAESSFETVNKDLLRYLAYIAPLLKFGINSKHFANLSESGEDELMQGTFDALVERL